MPKLIYTTYCEKHKSPFYEYTRAGIERRAGYRFTEFENGQGRVFYAMEGGDGWRAVDAETGLLIYAGRKSRRELINDVLQDMPRILDAAARVSQTIKDAIHEKYITYICYPSIFN